MAIARPPSGPLTVDDLEDLPDDDGNRYELLDGELLVSAAPNVAHQRAVLNLAVLFKAGEPPDLMVLFAPFDWRVDARNQFEPDLLVFRRADVEPLRLERTPLLAVEVLSPSTRRVDLVRKRAAYERSGLRSYWVVDPAVPSLTVLELRGGRFVEVASAAGDERYDTTKPYPVSVVPASLLL